MRIEYMSKSAKTKQIDKSKTLFNFVSNICVTNVLSYKLRKEARYVLPDIVVIFSVKVKWII